MGLAVVCDEYFVPALEVLTDRMQISNDVAGATLMAAGGSAPELATSFLGVFVAKSDVGFGTIVGSAVFNVLFVIGMCVLYSKDTLHLTAWPLVRDCFYYALSLGALAVFVGVVSPGEIEWWEALVLLGTCLALRLLFLCPLTPQYFFLTLFLLISFFDFFERHVFRLRFSDGNERENPAKHVA